MAVSPKLYLSSTYPNLLIVQEGRLKELSNGLRVDLYQRLNLDEGDGEQVWASHSYDLFYRATPIGQAFTSNGKGVIHFEAGLQHVADIEPLPDCQLSAVSVARTVTIEVDGDPPLQARQKILFGSAEIGEIYYGDCELVIGLVGDVRIRAFTTEKVIRQGQCNCGKS